MSEKKVNTGGPAFPGEQGHDPCGRWNQTWEPGMTLRQWYAGRALTGLLSIGHDPIINGKPTKVTRACFMLADTMIAYEENEKKGKTNERD